MKNEAISIFWFRRDLRLHDNHGLFLALDQPRPVLPIYIFKSDCIPGTNTSSKLNLIADRLSKMNQYLRKNGQAEILILQGEPIEILSKITSLYHVAQVFANEEYDPSARLRDLEIHEFLRKKKIDYSWSKDHVIYAPYELATLKNQAYRVFTPFSKKWMDKLLTENPVITFPSHSNLQKLYAPPELGGLPLIHILENLYEDPPYLSPSTEELISIIKNYDKTRDIPGLEKGSTRVGPALRYGLMSIRYLVALAMRYNQTYLKELIWREYFQHLIYHYPDTETKNFKNLAVPIENDPEKFEKWKQGQTGYLLIDAAMNQLNQSGYMHNRLRMLTANFLCKILWIEWKWGERYFASKLLDYELGSNIGNWQWAAGTGVDASPYFRIFNPDLQLKKFDRDLRFIKKWLPYPIDNPPERVENYAQRRRLYLQIMAG